MQFNLYRAMESLNSSFLSKTPKLINVSSPTIQKSHPPKITTYLFLTTLKPIKKLIIQNNKPVNPNKPEQTRAKRPRNQTLLVTIFNFLDEFICGYIDLPLPPSVDPKHVLSTFSAPVNELPPTPCHVAEGHLPSCLDGAYIRNGPNPQFTPLGPYHLFDGDGMLHMIKISKGKATLTSRYIKTYKYLVECEIGHSIFPSVFSSFNGLASSMARSILSVARVVTGQFDPITHGFGTANTSLALFNGRLFALCESDLPYQVKITSDGDIITLGRHDFQSNEPFFRMTAHPKIDYNTGEAFAYRFNFTRPFLTYFRIDCNGRKQKDVPISIEKLTLIHDFGVTVNCAIFPETQIVIDPMEVMRGKSPVRVDSDKVPRLGIIPRYAEDEREMAWIDAPGFNMMHSVNAWEEDGGNVIVMVATNVLTVDLFCESIDRAKLSLEKIKINVNTKTVERQSLCRKFLEFGVINPTYAAKKNRYVYAAFIDALPRGAGVVKLDLSVSESESESGDKDCVVARHVYKPGCYGGEPFFVAREPNNPEAEEDDGYLVTYVHDDDEEEEENGSKFLVMDAKSPSLDTIAVVKLPQRVPLGFHGLFVTQNDLNKM